MKIDMTMATNATPAYSGGPVNKMMEPGMFDIISTMPSNPPCFKDFHSQYPASMDRTLNDRMAIIAASFSLKITAVYLATSVLIHANFLP